MTKTARSSPITLLLWVLITAVLLMVSGLSIARYMGYNASMLDLGNMTQAIWSVTQGKPLILTYPLGQISRLSGHVELFYVFLALPYALWPDPRLLLAIQAALFALGAVPIYHLATRRLSSPLVALALAAVYLFYPAAQTAVLFDLHGDTLAMPLLLFAFDALDRRAWRWYALCIVLALTCKVYVALPVAGIGACAFLWMGHRRVGVLTMSAAVIYGAVAFFLIRPFFTLQAADFTAQSHGYVHYYFGQANEIGPELRDRLFHGAVVFLPAILLIPWGWRWLWPGLLVGFSVLISTGLGPSYDFRYHHYALVVSFILRAAIDGAEHMKARAETQKEKWSSHIPLIRTVWRWQGAVGATLLLVGLAHSLLVNTPLNQLFWSSPPGWGFDPSSYGVTSRDAMKDRFLATVVPPKVPFMASIYLAPQRNVIKREVLYIVRYPEDSGGERLPSLLPQVNYVLTDALFDYRVVKEKVRVGGGPLYEQQEISYMLRDSNFGLVTARDGLLLFERGATGEQALNMSVTEEEANPLPPARETFGESTGSGNAIGLLEATFTPVGDRRIRATFLWRNLKPSLLKGAIVPISRLDGVEDARIVHLPIYALLPIEQWQPNKVIRETFEVDLPSELAPGRYAWRVGWYDLNHPEAYATDERSRLPLTQDVVVGTVEVR